MSRPYQADASKPTWWFVDKCRFRFAYCPYCSCSRFASHTYSVAMINIVARKYIQRVSWTHRCEEEGRCAALLRTRLFLPRHSPRVTRLSRPLSSPPTNQRADFSFGVVVWWEWQCVCHLCDSSIAQFINSITKYSFHLTIKIFEIIVIEIK